jgi:hypothetical protein
VNNKGKDCLFISVCTLRDLPLGGRTLGCYARGEIFLFFICSARCSHKKRVVYVVEVIVQDGLPEVREHLRACGSCKVWALLRFGNTGRLNPFDSRFLCERG